MLMSEQDNLIKWNGREKPFYENYYLKVNCPSLRAALWLRYTLVSPISGFPEAGVWAAFFSEKRPNCAIKESFAMNEVVYRRGTFDLKIGDSLLNNTSAKGAISKDGHRISWDISWEACVESFRHLPFPFYYLPWPPTKVTAPNLAVPSRGSFNIDGLKFDLFGEIVHQGHVWGRRYSSGWAWADCGDFNEDKSAVLELLANKDLGLGFIKSSVGSGRLYVSGKYNLNSWEFKGLGPNLKISGKILAMPQNLIGVTYLDPDGSSRYCYNTNIATATVDVYKRCGLKWVHVQNLTSNGTTAFETVYPKPVK